MYFYAIGRILQTYIFFNHVNLTYRPKHGIIDLIFGNSIAILATVIISITLFILAADYYKRPADKIS